MFQPETGSGGFMTWGPLVASAYENGWEAAIEGFPPSIAYGPGSAAYFEGFLHGKGFCRTTGFYIRWTDYDNGTREILLVDAADPPGRHVMKWEIVIAPLEPEKGGA